MERSVYFFVVAGQEGEEKIGQQQDCHTSFDVYFDEPVSSNNPTSSNTKGCTVSFLVLNFFFVSSLAALASILHNCTHHDETVHPPPRSSWRGKKIRILTTHSFSSYVLYRV